MSQPILHSSEAAAERQIARKQVLRPGLWEWICLIVFVGLVAWQLFLPPVTGISDNNDFSKVFGPAKICKASPENLNAYLVTSYRAGPGCEWPSGFTSSEIWLVEAARLLSRPFTGRYRFDLRASAAVHLLILSAAMGFLLVVARREPPLIRLLLPALAILMFTDVMYVAYLNSAFMDNASWVFYLLLASVAAFATVSPPLRWVALIYGAAGILLIFSKAQHAILGLPFAGLAAYFGWRDRREPGQCAVWWGTSAALLAASVTMPALTPGEYRTISLFNVIFVRLAPADRSVLPQLGLDSGYEKYVGTNAFDPGSPLPDPDSSRAFTSRVSFGEIALLYLRRPGLAFEQLDRELHDSVHAMRPDYMANYRQADGFPPHTTATRFSLWSSFRARASTGFPYLLPILYGVLIAVAALRRSRFLPLALTIAVAGAGEFAVCTLADAIDTHRHLFLFHVITETVILLTFACLLPYRPTPPAELP